ncbi:MAG: peptidoglycan DD-metalloendopeptidase family protein [Candidatus Latescibacterota bacterium]|nr:MAG: peptidoglycan DD-metalloendopeptidase family protein [Candidatus Latescibacterota bacterium]
MRRLLPILVVLIAISVYTTRHVVLDPMRLDGKSPDGGATETTTGVGAIEAKSDAGADQIMGASLPGNVVHGEISRGTPFFVEMQRAGVPPLEIQRIVAASKSEFNFKKVKPGQTYSIYSDPTGDLDSLQFTVDAERILKITKIGEDYSTRIDTIPCRVDHYITSGTIHQSIYATLQEIEADPELASYLAAIFQWDIDFFKDIRKDDTFSILYEQKVFEDGQTQLGKVLAAKVFTQGEEHYAFRHRLKNGSHHYYDEKGKSLQKSLLRSPLKFSRVSSSFSYRRLHPVHRTYKPHLGVDYAAPHGTPVRSTGNGTVAAVTRNSSNGKYIKIRHNSRITTYYLHLSRFAKGIRVGKRVSQGQVIGYVGATGIATGPHLDYRIKVGGKFVNPRRIKLPPKSPVPADEMALFERTRDSCLLRFFEAASNDETLIVEKPSPVIQGRMEALF